MSVCVEDKQPSGQKHHNPLEGLGCGGDWCAFPALAGCVLNWDGGSWVWKDGAVHSLSDRTACID